MKISAIVFYCVENEAVCVEKLLAMHEAKRREHATIGFMNEASALH